MISITVDWTWWIFVVLVVDLIVRVVAIIVVPRNRRPTAAMAWLLAIYFIPFLGIFLFWLIGNPKLPKKRREMQEEVNREIERVSSQLALGTLRPHAPRWFRAMVRLNENLGALPLSGDNHATLYQGYEESIAEMTAAIHAAKKYIHVEFYILQLDDTTEAFFQAMEDAVARGVTVRVLLDHWANFRRPDYRKTVARLDRIGAQWHLMLPVQPLKGKWQRPDLRNHRKLLVVDGLVAFTGSQNLIDSSYNLPKNIRRGLKWVDLMVRVEGPVVGSINAVFLTDWYTETGEALSVEMELFEPVIGHGDLDCQIIPSGPGFEYQNNLKCFMDLLFHAERQIIIVSPYFIPDEGLLLAIQTACQRGVAVELFVSEDGDQAIVYHAQRSYYEALLRAGVRIWLYRKPYILHSKSMSIDDGIAVVGSSNMDMRSFGLNMEISLLVRGEEFVTQLREVEENYRKMSRELTLEEWLTQPLRSTILDNLARLTSSLQ